MEQPLTGKRTQNFKGKKKGAKKPALQLCPFEGCTQRNSKIKQHVQLRHLPAILRDAFPPPSMDVNELNQKRMSSIRLLIQKALGPQADLNHAVDFLNKSGNLPFNTTIHPSSASCMEQLCHYEGWDIPVNGFSASPINSPAVLCHWRCLSLLLACLDSKGKEEFHNHGFLGVAHEDEKEKKEDGGADGAEKPINELNNSSVLPQAPHPVLSNLDRNKSSENFSQISVSHTDPLMSVTPATYTLGQPEVNRDTDIGEFYIRRNSLLHPPPQPLPLFDSTAPEQVYYYEPYKYPDIIHDMSKYMAIGVHPKLFYQFGREQLSHMMYLMQYPNNVALGPVGLDRSIQMKHWRRQEEVFRMALSALDINKVLVIYLRGTLSDDIGIDVHARCMQILKNICSPDQFIHLYNFTGDVELAKDWMDRYSNVYFGFTEKVNRFSRAQVDGVRSIPLNRILLEDTHKFDDLIIGEIQAPCSQRDIACTMALMLKMSEEHLLKETIVNFFRLYGEINWGQ